MTHPNFPMTTPHSKSLPLFGLMLTLMLGQASAQALAWTQTGASPNIFGYPAGGVGVMLGGTTGWPTGWGIKGYVVGGGFLMDNNQFYQSKSSTGTQQKLLGLNGSNLLSLGEGSGISGINMYTAGTQRAWLLSDGRLGYGISPTAQAFAHFQKDSWTTDMLRIQGNAGGNAPLKALALRHGNTPAAGNLGQAVDIDFSLEGPGALQADAGKIRVGKESDFTGAAGNLANVDSYLGLSTTLNGSLTEKMRITGLGKVGIGTNIPGAKLDLQDISANMTNLFNSNINYQSGVTGDYAANTMTASYGGSSSGILTGLQITVNHGGNPTGPKFGDATGLGVIVNNTGLGASNAGIFQGGSVRIYGGSNVHDFSALHLRAASAGGDKTRIVFNGDNNGDYAQIVGTALSPATGNPTAGSLSFRTRNGIQSGDMRDQLTITESGKFILGGPAANLPSYELHPTDGSSATNNGNGSHFLVAAGACDNTSTKYGGNLYLRAGGKNVGIGNYGKVAIADDGGQVTIGTDNPNSPEKLVVSGDAKVTGNLQVAAIKTQVWSIAPDYVFEKEYKLSSLEHVEKYVKENKHLPEIPSAKEIKDKGIDLADMNMKLLRKVEELTLHAIDQQKQLTRLQLQVSDLQGRR